MKLIIEPAKKTIEIKETQTILSGIIQGGLFIPASCGGFGTCGRCKVILEDGEVMPPVKKGDFILACQAKPKGNLKIRIPESSPALDKASLKNGSLLQEAKLIQPYKLLPIIKKIYIKLPPPTKEDNIDDLTRIKRGFGNNYELSFDCVKTIGKALRENNFAITATIKDKEIIRIEGKNKENRHFALAFDIGTTSIYGRLLDLNNNRILSEASDYNRQISYGDDVISRIIYSQKANGLFELQNKAIETIEDIIEELLIDNVSRDDISYIVCAGNTTMIHLLLGLDPKYIREEPYVPTISKTAAIPISLIGLKFNHNPFLYTLPCVSSYIGGDITGGVMAIGMRKSPLITLYVDLGTNGEIVLGNCDFLLSCSTSAGPAFEGGGIKCGIRPGPGVINGITIDRNKEPRFTTIGGGRPKGICGAALIELLAQMLFFGVIDQRGKFNKIKNKRMREDEYVIAWGYESLTSEDIVITEADIDNIMRAKAAIFAGISILLKTSGIKKESIERVIIAGNLGSHIIPENAINIGLFPEIELDKFYFLGNGSLIGATLFAFSEKMKEEVERVAGSITNIELSNNKAFMDEYIASMFLPHTDSLKFPKTYALINKQKII